MARHLQGSVLSSGLCIASAIKREQKKAVVKAEMSDEDSVQKECERFLIVKNRVRQKLSSLISENSDKTENEILRGYIAMLDDAELKNDVCEKIKAEHLSLNAALSCTADEYIADMLSLEDEYLRQRADDFKQLFSMLIENNNEGDTSLAELFDSPSIFAAKSISPIDIAEIGKANLLGILVETGSKTSHAAILARASGIPMLSEVAVDEIKTGDKIIIDGESILINPDKNLIEEFEKRIAAENQKKLYLKSLISKPAVTKDGTVITLMANIGSDKDIQDVLKQNADGIGLFRTEFILESVKQGMPSEEFQFEIYRAVLSEMKNKPVTIRTFDIGGDKTYPCFLIPKEDNPFLGWRGIRCMLDNQTLLLTQLKALYRASIFGNLQIMFPMITTETEVLKIKELLNSVKKELDENSIAFSSNIKIGIMIETPAAALIADELAPTVDFFSIGTNDLTQYTLAVDRGNAKIAALYDEAHPAVFKLISQVIRCAQKHGIDVGLCGEMAGNPAFTRPLLKLGLKSFSMNAIQIQAIKDIVINEEL